MTTKYSRGRNVGILLLASSLLAACGGGEETTPEENPNPTPTGYTYVKPPGSTPLQDPWWPQEISVSNKVWKKTASAPPTGAAADLNSPVQTYTAGSDAITMRYQENLPRGAEGFLASRENVIAKNKAVKGSQRTPAGPLTCVLPVDGASNVTVLCAGKASEEFPGVFVAETSPSPIAHTNVRELIEQLQKTTGFKPAAEGGLKNELGVTSEGVAFTRQVRSDYTMTLRGGYKLNYRMDSKFAPIRIKDNTTVPNDPRENLAVFYNWQASVRNLTPGFPARLPAAKPIVLSVWSDNSPVCKLKVKDDRGNEIFFAERFANRYCSIAMAEADLSGSGTIDEGDSFTFTNHGDRPDPSNEINVIQRSTSKGVLSKMMKELENPIYTITVVDETSNKGQDFTITSGSCKTVREPTDRYTGDIKMRDTFVITTDSKLCDFFGGTYAKPVGDQEVSTVSPTPTS